MKKTNYFKREFLKRCNEFPTINEMKKVSNELSGIWITQTPHQEVYEIFYSVSRDQIRFWEKMKPYFYQEKLALEFEEDLENLINE